MDKTQEPADLARRAKAVVNVKLKREGYRIIGYDWRCPAGTADFIARKDGAIVFVDVRTSPTW